VFKNSSPTKIIMPVIFFLLLILFSANIAWAGNKFRYLQEGSKIPRDKFIYALMNVDSGRLWLGYSQMSSSLGSDGQIIGGVRNGGHGLLLMKALGIGPGELAEFRNLLPKAGLGRHVGGGFIYGSNGVTYLHQSMSNKAAGQLSHFEFTINPLLKRPNRVWSAMIPQWAAADFYERIAKLTKAPLVIDQEILGSGRFKFNAAKYPRIFTYEAGVIGATSWMVKTVEAVNQKVFPTYKAPLYRSPPKQCIGLARHFSWWRS
jgi:hypothetical protein